MGLGIRLILQGSDRKPQSKWEMTFPSVHVTEVFSEDLFFHHLAEESKQVMSATSEIKTLGDGGLVFL